MSKGQHTTATAAKRPRASPGTTARPPEVMRVVEGLGAEPVGAGPEPPPGTLEKVVGTEGLPVDVSSSGS